MPKKKSKDVEAQPLEGANDQSEGEENFVMGASPSPHDTRDFVYDALRNKDITANEDLPKEFTLVASLPPVRNQGSQGSCVAQAGACIKEYQEQKDYGFGDHMSPQFLYNNRDNYPRVGWDGRSLMTFLQKSGVCFEDTFPYDSRSDADQQKTGVVRGDQIPAATWTEAANHKIITYALVEYVAQDNANNEYRLKDSIMKNGPAYIAFPVYSGAGATFWRAKNEDGSDRICRGGHALAVVGWTAEGFIIRNSWGEKWNGNGYVIYPYVDFYAKCHWELWTCVDDKSKVLNWKKNDPKSSCCNIM